MKTIKPPIDIAKAVPELGGRKKVTFRLHPMVSKGEGGIFDSKMGGKFGWPIDEKWPIDSREIPYVPVLQLNIKDLDGIEFPEGMEIFQLLWDTDSFYNCKVYWRNTLEESQYTAKPENLASPSRNIPIQCRFSPESVEEFPSALELEDDFYDNMIELAVFSDLVNTNQEYRCFTENPVDCYEYCLSVAEGTKVGGYCNWIQDPEVPICNCGKKMEYFLTVASDEFDLTCYLRWLPTDNKDRWQSGNYITKENLRSPAGLCLGDCGSVFVFVCKSCKDWPVKTVFQCS